MFNDEDVWYRIKELDLRDEETGLITRYTMKNVKGEIKYIYWDDLVKICSEPQWEEDYV